MYIHIDSIQFLFLFLKAEQDGFSHFHLYICAAFLIRFSKDLLREKDFHVNRNENEKFSFLLHNFL